MPPIDLNPFLISEKLDRITKEGQLAPAIQLIDQYLECQISGKPLPEPLNETILFLLASMVQNSDAPLIDKNRIQALGLAKKFPLAKGIKIKLEITKEGHPVKTGDDFRNEKELARTITQFTEAQSWEELVNACKYYFPECLDILPKWKPTQEDIIGFLADAFLITDPASKCKEGRIKTLARKYRGAFAEDFE